MTGSVLITGSSRGIGLALSREFAKHGWTVFAAARNPTASDLAASAKEFPKLVPIALDVIDDHSVGECADAVGRQTPTLDVLVNNAAVFPGEGNEHLEELDLSWFTEAMETNVVGVARVTRAFLPLLRKSSQARIANISSGAGSISEKEDFDYYPYSVSKAALNMLTRSIAAELRPENIAVAAISPGWVKTEMGGPNAPLTPEESAAALYRTISTLPMAQSGMFLGRDGSTTEYRW